MNGPVTHLVAKKISKTYKNSLDMLAIGITLAEGAYAYNEIQKNMLTYGCYRIPGGERVKKDRRIVFLSDLHEKEFGKDNAALIRFIDNAAPDMVLIGGDMIVSPKNLKRVAETLSVEATMKLCRELASRYPVYYAPGNHEQRIADSSFMTVLESYGVNCLDDRTVFCGEDLAVSGLRIEERFYRSVCPDRMTGTYVREHLGRLDGNRYQILLAHSPLFLDAYAAGGADLILSGHFHGGTIRLPGNIGLMTPQYQFFSNRVVGLKEKDAAKMIVSPGLGTHSVNIRINDKPQVVVVDLKKGAK